MTAGTLRDLGERRIISEILMPRYAASTRFGDDCASVVLTPGTDELLVATTDPCPPPMATALGFDDLYFTGWLLSTLNLSDLAAAGARPLGLLTSLTLPADTPIESFTRLLDGIDACCAAVGTQVVGGNLKESQKLDVSATALGSCSRHELLTRNGARPGDRVVVVGDFGSFWAGALGYRAGLIAEGDTAHDLMRNVLTPVPKVPAMRALAEAGLLRAAMDNSDGLYPSLIQLSGASGLGIVLEADQIAFAPAVKDMAERLSTEPIRLALGWGDWHVVAACDPSRLREVTSVALAHGTQVRDIGTFDHRNGVRVRLGSQEGPLMPLDSERFTTGSWFSSGLESYVSALRNAPLMTRS
jgi:thiamine-monophosphate kinase